tara:strand:+ start:729 stop:1595 length:867 start_codon:yes stop_codon:yes gene_type:complete
MSKKNLLNESQVRQFMKLASLEPLTPGFVDGLTEKQGAVDKEDEHLGAKDGPERDKKQSMKDRRKEMRGEDRAEGDNPAAVEETKDYTAKKEKPGADKRKGAEKRGAEGTLAKTKGHGRVDYVDESHGRGKREGAAGYGALDNNSRLEEEEDPAELEGDIAHDLGDDSFEGDEEAAADEDEIAGELGGGGGGDRQVSVDDFLAALENTLEDFLGDEVEVDASDMSAGEDEVEDDVDVSMGVDGGDDELEISAEEELQETGATPTMDELVEQVTKRVAARILKSALSKK